MILANRYEQPMEGKATLYACHKGQTQKVDVVKGRGFEHLLSKPTMLKILIKILDCDRDLHINVPICMTDTDALLEKYEDVFNGLRKLDGKYTPLYLTSL